MIDKTWKRVDLKNTHVQTKDKHIGLFVINRNAKKLKVVLKPETSWIWSLLHARQHELLRKMAPVRNHSLRLNRVLWSHRMKNAKPSKGSWAGCLWDQQLGLFCVIALEPSITEQTWGIFWKLDTYTSLRETRNKIKFLIVN